MSRLLDLDTGDVARMAVRIRHLESALRTSDRALFRALQHVPAIPAPLACEVETAKAAYRDALNEESMAGFQTTNRKAS